MKKIILFIFACICSVSCWAVEYAPIANLEYIHTAIADKYDITIQYNPAVTDITSAANMKYLLTAIDVANTKQGQQTNYGTSEFATEFAANIITVNTAIDTLIKSKQDEEEPEEPEPGDELLTPPYVFGLKTSATNSFSFDIAAKGTYTIDWGDGTIETKTQTSAYTNTYSHTYADSQPRTIRIGGQATEYYYKETYTQYDPATISFASRQNVTEYFGSLGKIFPTMPDGSQPRFLKTFYDNTSLTYVPKKLFSGITGRPASFMFYQTFYRCNNLEELPIDLFGGLNGAPNTHMFYQTFAYCSKLKYIPERLFGNIHGRPDSNMYYGTFSNCTGLTGEIPLGLFGNLDNYYRSYMFYQTFYNCRGLTGPSARMPDGTYLYNYFTTGSGYYYLYYMYSGCTGLSDYSSIPSNAK